jgi:disulfide bond formation protein DsbB
MLAALNLSRFSLAAAVVGAGALGVFLGALGMEHWGGLAACHLCLLQRGPLVAAAILAAIAFAVSPYAPGPARLALGAAGLTLLIGAGIGVYHSGIELGWWAGPQSCTGAFTVPTSAAEMAAALSHAQIIRCDVVPWSLAGLSLANYNVLFSGALAALAAAAVCLKAFRT